MKKLNGLILLCGWMAVSHQIMAQHVVSGTVRDLNGNHALTGVTVAVIGNAATTVTTNQEGNYSIQVPSADGRLRFSYVGYQSLDVDIGKRTVVDIALAVQESALDEVVVVGYGTVKKSDLTGSVTSLREDDFNKGAITSVEDMMMGKAAGVQVVQNSGEPGGGMSINVRGVGSITGGTSPLYVIDGLPVDNTVLISGTGNQVAPNRSPRNPLSSLNSNDIESIEILKDASATAIYGSRGANGVVIVTTKSGASGALQVGYNGQVGLQNVHQRLNLLNAEQYKEGVNALIDAGQGTPAERVTEIHKGGTDWQDVVFEENALTHNHDITFSWGNPSTNYLVALNNMNQDGILKGSAYRRYGGRFNLKHDTDKLRIGLSSSVSYVDDQLAPFGFDIGERGGAINAAKVSDPTLPVRDESGNYVLSPHMSLDNAEAIITGTHMEGNRYRYFGTMYADYSVLPSLAVKVNIGGDMNNEDRTIYKDRNTLLGRDLGGIGTGYEGVQTNYLIESTVSYRESFNEHRVNAVAGATFQRFLRRTSSIEGSNFITDATGAFNFSLADPATITAASAKRVNQLLSYLGRVNYTYRDRYTLTASYRIDGSSRFGEANRFGYFPSFAVGWSIDQESFFEPLRHNANTFKLRASWGKTGNQDIGNNEYLVTFASGSRTSYVLDDQFVNSLNPTRMANPDLKWETTEQYNIGLDYGLFRGRVSGSIDWFKKSTYDMLIDLPIPAESGYTSRLVNIGSMQNEGFEFMITSKNFAKEAFSWRTDFNFATLKNTVKNLGGIDRILTGSMSQHANIGIITPGLPILSYYGYDVLGIWQQEESEQATQYGAQPGDFKFRDIDENGSINADDRVSLGDAFPAFSWGLGNTFTLKSFELYVFLQGVEGVKMLNGNLLETYLPRGDNIRSNRLAEPFLNRWTPNNPTNDQPSFLGVRQFSQSINSKTVADASYVKLQTVRLSYHLSPRFLKGVVRSAQVFVSGQNIWTISGYQGFDPALNPQGSANFRIDWNGYPSATTYLMGLNLTL